MLKIIALNEDIPSSDSDDESVLTKEAQEAIALSKYNKALILEKNGKIDEALIQLKDITLECLPKLEDKDGLSKKLLNLKYCCYRNISSLFYEKKLTRVALNYLIDAAEIDGSDVTLWHRIGLYAMEIQNYVLAVNAFKKGLEKNPNHWPSLDKIVLLLYALNEDVLCLSYISKAFQLDSDYLRGLIYRSNLYKNNTALKEYYELYNPDYTLDPPLNTKYNEKKGKKFLEEAEKLMNQIKENNNVEESNQQKNILELVKPLEEYTWVDLGKTILQMYEHIEFNEFSVFSKFELNKTLVDKETIQNEANDVIEFSSDDEDSTDSESSTDSEDLETSTKSFCLNLIVDCLDSINYDKKLENVSKNVKENGQIPMDIDYLAISSNPSSVEETSKKYSKEIENQNLLSNPSSVETLPDQIEIDPENNLDNNLEINKEKSTELDSNDKENSNKEEIKTPQIQIRSVEKINEIATGKNVEKMTTETVKINETKNEVTEIKKDLQCTDNKTDDTKIDIKKSVNLNVSKPTNNKSRRRSSLSMLEIWGWHSKRKSNRGTKTQTEKTNDDNILTALKKLIPSSLLFKEDKNEGVKIDDKSKNNENQKIDLEEYFGTEKETKEIKNLWESFSTDDLKLSADIVTLIEYYVTKINSKWIYKWPTELIDIYLKIYLLYRLYFKPHSILDDVAPEKFIIDAEISLLNSELILYQWLLENESSKQTFKDETVENSFNCLDVIISSKDFWTDNKSYLNFLTRAHWLKVLVYINQFKYQNAINELEDLISDLKEYNADKNFEVILLNSTKHQKISLELIENFFISLKRYVTISQTHELFENECYPRIIPILQETFDFPAITWPDSCPGRADRPLQILMLIDSLWFTNQLSECLIWSEKALAESCKAFLNLTPEDDSFKRWNILIINCLETIKLIIKEEGTFILSHLEEQSKLRLIDNLIKLCCYQIDNKHNCLTLPFDSFAPWIILQNIIQFEEDSGRIRVPVCDKKNNESDDEYDESEDDIPPSMMILFIAHDYLGKKNWCSLKDGELLLYMVDLVLPLLRTPCMEVIREKISPYIEQMFYCLYQHPSKKNNKVRYLVDHLVPPQKLSWERAQQLYDFYRPDELPQFDSYANCSISSDTEGLFKRVIHLIPSELNLQPLTSKVTDYIENNKEDIFNMKPLLPPKISGIYYLLGDYYFKNKDIVNAYKYYVLDLSNNPNRMDSWAGMALGHASQLELKVNSCDAISDTEFVQKVRQICRCYNKALEFASDHSNQLVLLIEYGSFVYSAHSFCSRIMKTEAETLNMEKFESLEEEKETLLSKAEECFKKADQVIQVMRENEDVPDQDERWLHQYIQGKIAEKQKKEPSVYLDHYMKGIELLYEQNAQYPVKINYNNPQHLAIEALELHYRVHASILKYLELHENKPIPLSIGQIFKKALKFCSKSAFVTGITKEDVEKAKLPDCLVLNDDDDVQVVIDVDADKNLSDSTKIIQDDINQNNAENKLNDNVVDLDNSKSKETVEKSSIENVEETSENCKKRMASEIENLDEIELQNKKLKLDETVKTKENQKEDDKHNTSEEQEILIEDLMKECIANIGGLPTTDEEPSSPNNNDKEKSDEQKSKSKNKEKQKSSKSKIEDDKKSNKNNNSDVSSDSSSSSCSSSDSSSDDDDNDSSNDDNRDESLSSSTSSSSDSEDEEKKLEKSKTQTQAQPTLSREQIDRFMQQCVDNMERCLCRFQEHYKSFYRLAHFYFNRPGDLQDLGKCRQLFLSQYRCKNGNQVAGLFSDRKNNNFFSGIWVNPVSEIDRPGSFASHMSRCVNLLTQILKKSGDHRLLLQLAIQLKRTPDPDKKYLREPERIQLSEQAFSLCVQCLRELLRALYNGKYIQITPAGTNFVVDKPQKIQPISPGSNSFHNYYAVNAKQDSHPAANFLLDIFRAYQKVQKYMSNKETVFANILIDVYKFYKSGTMIENSSINYLDVAVKFCIQRLQANKLELQQINIQAAKQANNQTSSFATNTTTTVTNLNSALQNPTSTNLGQRSFTNKVTSTNKRQRVSNKVNASYDQLMKQFTSQNLNTNLAANPFALNPTSAMAMSLLTNYQNMLNSLNQNKQVKNNLLAKPLMNQNKKLNPMTALYSSNNNTTKKFNPFYKGPGQTTIKPVDNKFKAPNKDSILKAVYGKDKVIREKPKGVDSMALNILKDRPHISLTPLDKPSQEPLIATKNLNKKIPNVFKSTETKTLQEKLAEKKNQNNKKLFSTTPQSKETINLTGNSSRNELDYSSPPPAHSPVFNLITPPKNPFRNNPLPAHSGSVTKPPYLSPTIIPNLPNCSLTIAKKSNDTNLKLNKPNCSKMETNSISISPVSKNLNAANIKMFPNSKPKPNKSSNPKNNDEVIILDD